MNHLFAYNSQHERTIASIQFKARTMKNTHTYTNARFMFQWMMNDSNMIKTLFQRIQTLDFNDGLNRAAKALDLKYSTIVVTACIMRKDHN